MCDFQCQHQLSGQATPSFHHVVQGDRAGKAVFVEKQDAAQAFELRPGLFSAGPFSGGLELALREVGAPLVQLFARVG